MSDYADTNPALTAQIEAACNPAALRHVPEISVSRLDPDLLARAVLRLEAECAALRARIAELEAATGRDSG